jgi:hypothetical protein
MTPFVRSIDEFHTSTAPSDWLRVSVKLYVGDGIAEDFYVEMADFVDDERPASFDRCSRIGVRPISSSRPFGRRSQRSPVAGRLALWEDAWSARR